jgi:outer membrane protein with beta-barrel domain
VNSVNTGSVNFDPTSGKYTVGPSLQIGLPLHLRFEVDALYRPYSFNYTANNTTNKASGSQWRFPFLLQYRFGAPVVHPFIEAGLSFNHISDVSTAAQYITSGPGQLVENSHAGVVFGGGVEVKIPFVRVSGEIRYTREGGDYFRGITDLNQAEFLLGLRF